MHASIQQIALPNLFCMCFYAPVLTLGQPRGNVNDTVRFA